MSGVLDHAFLLGTLQEIEEHAEIHREAGMTGKIVIK